MSGGIIDIHAHVLPGVDDGSRTMEESVQMLKLAARQGVTAVIATPHYSRRHPLEGISERTEALQAVIRKSIPDFCIYTGQETFWHHELPERLNAGQALTMAGSRYVLVEFDPSVPYSELFRGIRGLQTAGYLPILAHIERYECLRRTGTEELRSCGCRLQMNYESLIGSFFSAETRWCRKQVSEETIDFLGTDMHRLDWRPPEIREAMRWLRGHVGEEYLKRITRKNAFSVIHGEQ